MTSSEYHDTVISNYIYHRVGTKPGFYHKAQPGGFYGFYEGGFLGVYGYYVSFKI